MLNSIQCKLTEARGGNFGSIQIFLIASTCFLYLIAAGLFSRAVWDFETNQVYDEMLLRGRFSDAF